jgi:hypothetical protein
MSSYRNSLLNDQHRMPYNAALWTGFLQQIGKVFEAERNLFFYSIAGEAHCPNRGKLPTNPTTAQLTDFYGAASKLLRAADRNPSHLICTGGRNQLDWNGGIDWKTIFKLPTTDVVAVHAYDMNAERHGQGPCHAALDCGLRQAAGQAGGARGIWLRPGQGHSILKFDAKERRRL